MKIFYILILILVISLLLGYYRYSTYLVFENFDNKFIKNLKIGCIFEEWSYRKNLFLGYRKSFTVLDKTFYSKQTLNGKGFIDFSSEKIEGPLVQVLKGYILLPDSYNDGNYNLIFNHSPEINFKFYLGKSSFKDPQKIDENDVMLKKKLKKISESKKSYLHNFKLDNLYEFQIIIIYKTDIIDYKFQMLWKHLDDEEFIPFEAFRYHKNMQQIK